MIAIAIAIVVAVVMIGIPANKFMHGKIQIMNVGKGKQKIHCNIIIQPHWTVHINLGLCIHIPILTPIRCRPIIQIPRPRLFHQQNPQQTGNMIRMQMRHKYLGHIFDPQT